MKANQKFTQADDAVSPVIGVILMVAITVVLAAVVFVLVSDLGGDATVSSFPQARISETDFGGDAGDGNITIEHRGGDCIEIANYLFRVDGDAMDDTVDIPSDPDGNLNITGTSGGNFCVGDTITMGSEDGTDEWDGTTATVTVIQRDSQAIVYENDITL